MTSEQIKKSIETNQLQLTNNWDRFTHYAIILYLILYPILNVYLIINNYLKGRNLGINDWTIGFTLSLILFAFLFFKLQKKRLNFTIIETKLNVEELINILDNLSLEQNWTVEIKNKSMYFAKTNPSIWSGSWGEQITILFDNKRVLLNSICDLEQRSSLVSMGRNKKNVDVIVDRIKNCS